MAAPRTYCRSQRTPRRVLVVVRSVTHYRRRFYELLRDNLLAEGVELVVIYGQPDPSEASRGGLVTLEWAVERRTRFLPIGGRMLYWQPCLGSALRADLVIVEQASRMLANYVLLCAHMAGIIRLALWGHGRTPTVAPPSRLGEAAKTAVSRRVHWWFAYNQHGAAAVSSLGFPSERITAVHNAIDTRAMALAGAAVTGERIAALRDDLRLEGDHVCIYAGAMYAEKRLPFLIAAGELIREKVPDFELLVVGSGPDHDVVREAASRCVWLHDLGPLYGPDLAEVYCLARLALMPGRVGLGVLDALTLAVPMITTTAPYHAPEIEYLEDGVNGVSVPDWRSSAAYADAVAALLLSPAEMERLRDGCRRTATLHSVEDMAQRFAQGVLAALDAPRRPVVSRSARATRRSHVA